MFRRKKGLSNRDYYEDFNEHEEQIVSNEFHQIKTNNRQNTRLDRGTKSVTVSQIPTEDTQAIREQAIYLEYQLELKKQELAQTVQILSKKEHRLTQTLKESKEENDALKKEIQRKNQELLQMETSVKSYEYQLEQAEAKFIELKQDAATVQLKLEEKIKQLKAVSGSSTISHYEYDEMKNDLAELLLETQEQKKQTLKQAEWEAERKISQATREADRRVAKAAEELERIKKEARDYYKKLEDMKEESSYFMGKLLAKGESIVDRLPNG